MTTIDRVSELEVKWNQVNTSVISFFTLFLKQKHLNEIRYLDCDNECSLNIFLAYICGFMSEDVNLQDDN
ncbi:hypothetical protein T4E_8177 [Trichinella pseudospiralis]|uniref:Uncharacterized protein n=1 Tax=Trichinella pseudospiralis TaxID=6337 RepID=A0A0V0YHK3_TRIPS|nr:hypothetical protein T4E_8177 [Trichinella pseudospiralis]